MSSNNLKKNFIYKVIYQIVAILVPLITTPYLARVLGAHELGNYGYTYSIMIYFGLVAVFGFNIYGRREIAKVRDDKHQKSKVFFELMIAKAIPATISIVAFVLLAVFYKEYLLLLLMMTPFLIYHLLDVTFFVQGEENFKYVTLRDLFIKVCSIVLIFVFVKRPQDVWIYALITSGTQLISGLLMVFYLKGKIQKVSLKELQIFIHLRKSLMFLVPAFASTVFLYADKIMIKWITGSSIQVGYYEESIKIIMMLTGLTTAIANVIEPRNAHEIAIANLKVAQNNVVQGISYSFVVSLPIMCGLICISSIFTPIFFGDGFDGVVPILTILCVLIPFITINELIGTAYLIPSGRERIFTRIILICAMINILLNILMIHFFGAVGAAISTVCSELVKTIILCLYVRNEIQFKNVFLSLIKKIISIVIMLSFVLPMSLLSGGSVISLFGIIAVGVVLFFGSEYILLDLEFLRMARFCLSPFLKLGRKKKNE